MRAIRILLIIAIFNWFGIAHSKSLEINLEVIEGRMTPIREFRKTFGSGFELRVGETIEIFHKTFDRGLIYPVNPPYRFSNHLRIGSGYDQSTADSIKNSPRKLKFIYRETDFKNSWECLNCILWNCTNKSQETALNQLNSYPTGDLVFEILSGKLKANLDPVKSKNKKKESSNKKSDVEEIEELTFRATLTWPKK